MPGPGLYRYMVAKLDGLGLAYIQLMHLGDDAQLGTVCRSSTAPAAP